MGRPTDSPKRYEVKARVDEKTFEILTAYCEKTGKLRAEAIRDAIHRLESALKE